MQRFQGDGKISAPARQDDEGRRQRQQPDGLSQKTKDEMSLQSHQV
jgi:hypothetical protein